MTFLMAKYLYGCTGIPKIKDLENYSNPALFFDARLHGVGSFFVGTWPQRIVFLLGLLFSVACLISSFRYRLTLSDDYIEATEFTHKRIYFKDVISVGVTDWNAYIKSEKSRIFIPQNMRAFRAAIGQVLQTQDKFHFDIYGRHCRSREPFYFAKLLQSANPSEQNRYSERRDIGRVMAHLIAKGRVYRKIKVEFGGKTFCVEYAGMGNGYECVLVDGEVVDYKRSIFWYAPEFHFQIDNASARVSIRFCALFH